MADLGGVRVAREHECERGHEREHGQTRTNTDKHGRTRTDTDTDSQEKKNGWHFIVCGGTGVSLVAPKKTLRNLNAPRTVRAFIKLPSALK
jgi:hypothetical protein